MIQRRDLILGGACAAGAGAAYVLKPRRHVSLMQPGKKLADILPANFGGWTSEDVSDEVAQNTTDSLSARLYGETVVRNYTLGDAKVAMLMAHGDEQSNELQLHRPEVCYPAFGYTLLENVPLSINLGNSIFIPGRRLLAKADQTLLTIFYWTRLGELFPITVSEQRWVRLNTALHRYVADGMLARFSVVDGTKSGLDTLTRFIPALIEHVAAGARRPIIGSARAALLAEIT